MVEIEPIDEPRGQFYGDPNIEWFLMKTMSGRYRPTLYDPYNIKRWQTIVSRWERRCRKAHPTKKSKHHASLAVGSLR